MKRFLSAILLLLSGLHAKAQSVAFSFNHPGMTVPVWGIEIHADGKGTYWEPDATTGKRTRDIEVGKPTLERMMAGRTQAATRSCETKAKHIADTGRKELTYTDGAYVHSCVFNYSDDKGVMDAAAAFQAVAETIQQSALLERDRRYDRLGLDADMRALAQEIKEGNAIEVGNIAPTLRAIARDAELMERVRSLAAAWLAQLPTQ